MELVYVTVIGLGIAAILRYLLPGRGQYGILLLPAIGAVATALTWVGLTWLGWKADGTWIWVVSLSVAGVAAIIAAIALDRGRRSRDRRMLHRLAGGRVAA